MLCAECPRCNRRSIIGLDRGRLENIPEPDAEESAKLRCDICGSRRVRIVRFESPHEGLRFVMERQGAG